MSSRAIEKLNEFQVFTYIMTVLWYIAFIMTIICRHFNFTPYKFCFDVAMGTSRSNEAITELHTPQYYHSASLNERSILIEIKTLAGKLSARNMNIDQDLCRSQLEEMDGGGGKERYEFYWEPLQLALNSLPRSIDNNLLHSLFYLK